jgi:hypothetical protein
MNFSAVTSARASNALLEIEAKEISPLEFRTRMLSHGAVFLRHAVPDDVILPLAEEIERMIDHFDGIPAEVIRREMQSDDAYRRSVWSQVLRNGVHYNYDLVVFSRGRHSLYDPIRKSLLANLLRDGWSGHQIVENSVTNVRRVFPANATGYSDTPLKSHVDAMFHQHDALGINFWLPLTTAGKDRPGLAVVPMGIEESKRYLEYSAHGHEPRDGDFAAMHHFRHEKLEPEKLQAAGLNFVIPHMNPGDTLAFTNFTIHATYVDEGMAHPRTSIEGRMLIEGIA